MSFEKTDFFSPIGGLTIATDNTLTDPDNPVWEFPTHRFIEWGPEDVSYARCAGYGHEVSGPLRGAVRMGNTLFVHPAFLEELKEQLQQENARVAMTAAGPRRI